MVSYELVPIFARFYSDETPSLLLPFLVRGSIWAVVGMAAGLALGWGWRGARGIPKALIGGLTGSVCGTIAFEVVNGVLFPGDRNDAVIPSSTPARLLADVFVSIGVVLGAAFSDALDRGRRAERPSCSTRRSSFPRSKRLADTNEVIGLEGMRGLLPGARHVALDAPPGGIDRAGRPLFLRRCLLRQGIRPRRSEAAFAGAGSGP